MVDREKIISTFKRIEKSLNLRFEKKRSLFIDKKDLEDLKRSISNGEMQNIQAMETKIDSAIITQVILKNPWLVSDALLQTRDFSSFLKINIARDNHIYFLRNIIDDNIYSTNEFKGFIEKIYYPLIKLSECKKIVKNMTLKDSVVLICFKRIMIDSTESGSSKIREINDFFNNNQKLYSKIKNQPYLSDIMNVIDNKDDVAEWILSNKEDEGKIDQVWANAFISLKIDAFNTAVNYIENNFDSSYKTNKWLFKNALPKLFIFTLKDATLTEDYSTKIINLYKHRDAYKIKLLFLIMLENFKNKELAHGLLDEFESIGISDKFEDKVNKIRGGSSASRGYNSYDDLYQKLINQSHNLTQKGTLDYFYSEFRKTDTSIIEELYIKNKDNENTLKIISYQIASDMYQKKSELMKLLSPLPSEYIDTIIEFISEYDINSNTTRAFLHDNNRDDILNKFIER